MTLPVDRVVSNIKRAAINNWRTIMKYRAPIFGMLAFSVFGMILTDTPCLIRVITGFPCPGCGLTRATFALLVFDFKGAFFFNPMVFLVWPLLFLLAYLFLSKKFQMKKFSPLFISFGIIMIAVFIVRMIIYFPGAQPLNYDFNSIFGRMICFLTNIIYNNSP